MGFKAMLAGYEAWIKTPQGIEFKEKSKLQKAVEITSLPDGWELEDGGVKEGFFTYSNYKEEMEILVQEHWGMPCWCGGYPEFQYIEVSRRYYDEDGITPIGLRKFSVCELGWDEAFKQANEFAKSKMERD